MISAKNRLKKDKDFDLVFKGGKSYYSSIFSLKVKENSLTFNRFGVLIGLKVSKKATERNLIKRRIKNTLSSYKGSISPGHDIVFVVFPLILGKSFQEIKLTIENSLKKSGLLK